jgi:hypothetical protein
VENDQNPGFLFSEITLATEFYDENGSFEFDRGRTGERSAWVEARCAARRWSADAHTKVAVDNEGMNSSTESLLT